MSTDRDLESLCNRTRELAEEMPRARVVSQLRSEGHAHEDVREAVGLIYAERADAARRQRKVDAKLRKVLYRMLDGEPLESPGDAEVLGDVAEQAWHDLRSRKRFRTVHACWALLFSMIFGSIGFIFFGLGPSNRGSYRDNRIVIALVILVGWSLIYAIRALCDAGKSGRRLRALEALNEQHSWWSGRTPSQ